MAKLHDIAKMHGYKSNEAFYKDYPTEESYQMKHGGLIGASPLGMTPPYMQTGGMIGASAMGQVPYAGPFTSHPVSHNPASQNGNMAYGGIIGASPLGMTPPYLQYGGQPDNDGDIDVLKNGGIHIKKANIGKFTAYKKRTGKTTEEALHSSDPHVRQMANFARNAKKWKHQDGGLVEYQWGGVNDPYNNSRAGIPKEVTDQYNQTVAQNPPTVVNTTGQPTVTGDIANPQEQQVQNAPMTPTMKQPKKKNPFDFASGFNGLLDTSIATGSFINSMNNARETHSKAQEMGLTDNMTHMNQPGVKGDYSPNNGYFRPDQMTPTKAGMFYPTAQYGGRRQGEVPTRQYIPQLPPISQNTINQANAPESYMRAAQPQSAWDKAGDIARNPMTAASYLVQNQRVPDNLRYAERNKYDYAIDNINPMTAIDAMRSSSNVMGGHGTMNDVLMMGMPEEGNFGYHTIAGKEFPDYYKQIYNMRERGRPFSEISQHPNLENFNVSPSNARMKYNDYKSYVDKAGDQVPTDLYRGTALKPKALQELDQRGRVPNNGNPMKPAYAYEKRQMDIPKDNTKPTEQQYGGAMLKDNQYQVGGLTPMDKDNWNSYHNWMSTNNPAYGTDKLNHNVTKGQSSIAQWNAIHPDRMINRPIGNYQQEFDVTPLGRSKVDNYGTSNRQEAGQLTSASSFTSPNIPATGMQQFPTQAGSWAPSPVATPGLPAIPGQRTSSYTEHPNWYTNEAPDNYGIDTRSQAQPAFRASNYGCENDLSTSGYKMGGLYAYGGQTPPDSMGRRALATVWPGSPSDQQPMPDNYQVGKTLPEAAPGTGDIEAEKQEQVLGDFNGDGTPALMNVDGPPHTQGGKEVSVPDNSFVFSDTKALKIKDKSVLAEFGMSTKGRRGFTPAEIAKKYDIQKYTSKLADPNTDPVTRKTAEMMSKNYLAKLSKLAQVQEGMKGQMGLSDPNQQQMNMGQEPQMQPQQRYGGLQTMQIGGSNYNKKGRVEYDDNGNMHFVADDINNDTPGTRRSNIPQSGSDYVPYSAPIARVQGYPSTAPQNTADYQRWANVRGAGLKVDGKMGYRTSGWVNPDIPVPGKLPTDNPSSMPTINQEYVPTTFQLPALPNMQDNNVDNTPSNNNLGSMANQPQKQDRRFTQPDRMALMNSILNAASIHKYMPFEPPVTGVIPQTTFVDPTRALAANAEQANSAYRGAGQRAGNDLSSYLAIQGQAGTNAANILGQYDNQNVQISNQANQQAAQITNGILEAQRNRLKSLHQGNTIAAQQYDNAEKEARADLVNVYTNAWKNRQGYNDINQTNNLYKRDPNYGFMNFNSPQAQAEYQKMIQNPGAVGGSSPKTYADWKKHFTETLGLPDNDDTEQLIYDQIAAQNKVPRTRSTKTDKGTNTRTTTSGPVKKYGGPFSNLGKFTGK